MATNDNDSGSKMPFTEHLEELRHRLIVCFIAVGVGFVICYFFAKQLFEILMQPLIQVMPPGEGLIFTALPEAFITYLKVALLAGIGLASPVIIYQFWRFIAPVFTSGNSGPCSPLSCFPRSFSSAELYSATS